MQQLLDSLKAIAEPTRLRIVVALESCELSVSEICQVLGQTQPRVSRHLRLLTDAGVLERHAEGANAYYGLASSTSANSPGPELLAAIAPLIDRHDAVIQRDRERLDTVRAKRAERAAAYFAEVAHEWDRVRELHAPTAEVEAAMLAAVAEPVIDQLLDIGTGTGRVIELFADRATKALGIDPSRQMLNIARARLDDDLLRHCQVRQGDVYDLDVPDDSQDVVVLHHVLHFLVDPLNALEVASRVLAPGGTLLLVDFASHDIERLRAEHAHSWLGFDDAEIEKWCRSLGLASIDSTHFPPPENSADEALTVTLWTATKTEPTSVAPVPAAVGL